MNPLMLIMGAGLVADGIGSIAYYWKQSLLEHAVRSARMVAGGIIFFYGMIL